MIELLIGLALAVGIVTMIGHFWTVWKPILIWLWALCRILFFLVVAIGGSIALWGYGAAVYVQPVLRLSALLITAVVMAGGIAVILTAAYMAGRDLAALWRAVASPEPAARL
jgi:hypothetical protein